MNCPDVTVNGYHLPTLARLARELDRPERGEVAWIIWRISSSATLPAYIEKLFMEAAGYRPFAGYPLQRAEDEKAAA